MNWRSGAVTGKYALVDTSAWILALKKGPAVRARTVIDDLLAGGRIAIIPVIRLELLGGTKSQVEFQRLERRLSALHQLPLAQAEWDESAGLAFKLRRTGMTVPYIDIIIAAAAILHGIPLVHADRHFDLIANEVMLKAENVLA
jgi:predicted nucleic acid-binding protein